MSNKKYFAADDANIAVNHLIQKGKDWFDTIIENNYIDKIKRSWDAYHGIYYSNTHEITWGGEQGELAQIAINHYRNIASNILNMVTANRPAFQARATNTDYKSQVQVMLADGLLDYYMREKRLEKVLKKAVEYAVVLGAGYIKMEWDSTKGEIYDYVEPEMEEDPETGEMVPVANPDTDEPQEAFPIYQGDVVFKNLSPFQVVFDSTKENYDDNTWVLVRTFLNKHDLAAKYPEQADKILELKTKNEYYKSTFTFRNFDETVDIPVYEFFHESTESLPNGRYILYLDEDIVLVDTVMPYKSLPIFRISPSDILGTPYGYTGMFDLLQIQEAVNGLYSTVLTNQNAFGVQNVLVPRNSDVRVNQLEGGMNFIEYNQQAGAPTPLNLTQTPTEIFNFLQTLERSMEVVSGINSVARGNPESSLKSGTALALVQSQALQFVSGLQQSYIQLIEDVGTGLINMLKDFAAVPRIAAIVGANNRHKMQEFVGSDLDMINRVIVDVGNALAQCLAKDTPVMMADGSTKLVQDIQIGDKVMGPDSKPRTVKNVNSGNEEMFEIIPKNKHLEDLKFTCNASHILTLKYCSDDNRYNAKKGDVKDISVREFLKLNNREQRLLQGFTTGLEFEPKEVLVDPYILGSWLGDGHSECPGITTADFTVVEYWENFATKFGISLRKGTNKNCGKASSYFLTSGKSHGKSDRNPIMSEFKRLELIHNKHIPELYLKNSREVRLGLLAGLLDSDGSLIGETFVFTQKNDKLANEVAYLAKSLGFRTTCKKIINKGGGKVPIGEYEINKVTIGGNTWEIPTKIPRKQVKECKKQKNWQNYGITVVSKGEGTYYGFTLEEEPHFVLGNFVVTHNTTAGKVQMAEQLLQMGLIDSPEKYLEVMNTGKLTSMTNKELNELSLIQSENETLLSGEAEVLAIFSDKHSLHIREHRAVIADPKLRLSNPELVQRVGAHINEHINLLRTTDPNVLAMFGEQPLGPAPGSPVAPGTVAAAQPATSGEMPGQTMQNPQAAGAGAGVNAPMQPGQNPSAQVPQPAQPPETAPDGSPVNPKDLLPG